MAATLLPDRVCGSCTACCTALKIDDPALQKPAGLACHHLGSSGGCGIYDTRPEPCRAFHCAWRFLPILVDAWRPDRSGVLIGFVDHEGGSALRLQTVREDAILQPFVLDFILSAVRRGAPLYFAHAPGQGAAFKTYLNERLAVEGADDPGAAIRVLKDLMAEQAAMRAVGG